MKKYFHLAVALLAFVMGWLAIAKPAAAGSLLVYELGDTAICTPDDNWTIFLNRTSTVVGDRFGANSASFCKLFDDNDPCALPSQTSIIASKDAGPTILSDYLTLSWSTAPDSPVFPDLAQIGGAFGCVIDAGSPMLPVPPKRQASKK